MRFSISLHPKSKKKGSDSNHADPKNIGREKNRKSQRRISQWLFQNSSSDSDHTKGTQKTMEHRESTQSFSNSSSFNNGSFPYREEIVGSSSSSVSSISEPVVWLESDSESIQAPQRANVIVDVDEISSLRHSQKTIELDGIPKSSCHSAAAAVTAAPATPSLSQELQDEIVSHSWRITSCRPTASLPEDLQIEIVNHNKRTTPASPTAVLPQELQAELVAYQRKVPAAPVASLPRGLQRAIVNYNRATAVTPTGVLPQALQQELTTFQRKAPVAPTASLPQALQREIESYERVKKVPQELLTDSSKYTLQKPISKSLPKAILTNTDKDKRPVPTVARASPQKMAMLLNRTRSGSSSSSSTSSCSSTSTNSSDDETVQALTQKCNDLTKLTEALSMKLLKDSTAKQHQKDTALQLVRSYQKDIFQLERQHHAQIKEVNGNMRHLEEQLRRYKVESVPPTVTAPNLTKAQRARALAAFSKKKSKVFEEMKGKTRRESNADLAAAVTSSLRPYSGQQQQPQRSSFTMASSIMLQNQFFPALVSAVASNVGTAAKKR